MDMAHGELRPAHNMDNSNLIEADASLGSSAAMTDAIRTTNGYQKTGDLITLPYTEEAYVSQSFASTTVNLNPYDTVAYVGQMTITPDQDEWMETKTLPEMTINIPGVFDTLRDAAGNKVKELGLGTVWNNWNDNWSGRDIAGTEQTHRERIGRRIDGVTTIKTQDVNNRTRTGIRSTLVPGGLVTQSMGNRVVQMAFAPFIRSKNIFFSASGLKPSTRYFAQFDGVSVDKYVTPTGSNAGAALTTNSLGRVTGDFLIPKIQQARDALGHPVEGTTDKWRTGVRTFKLTSVNEGVLSSKVRDQSTSSSESSAEADYTAKGMIQTVQGTVTSTREVKVQRRSVNDTSQIIGATGTRELRRQVVGWHDPVCQSFMVDQEDGLFVTSVDLFFAKKSSVIPATVQIRTMVNGYPTTTIVPFAEISVDSADITTSSDASEATRFTFPSPVYLTNATEYAICMMASNTDFEIYTAKMGDTTLDGTRLISQQPYLGSMFKSQNSSTWTAEQNEDVKFTINRAKFTTNTIGNVHLVNDVVPVEDLAKNPIVTTASSGVITVLHRNHGMHSTSNNVTIAGVPSGTFNGISSANINGTYTTIGNIKLDSYTVTAQNSDTATATGDIGGTAVTATRNIMYDVIKPIAGVIIPPTTSITTTMRNTTGRTLEQSEGEFTFASTAKQKTIDLNADFYFTAPQQVASAINETNEMAGSKSLAFNLAIFSATGADHISPVIDTTRLSSFLIRNRIYSPVSGTTPDFVADTANTGGSGPAQYITRAVILENESTSLDIRLSAHVPSTSEVEMFFRVSNADDARLMGDLAWIPFNDDGSPDKTVPPSDDDVTFKEHQYSADNIVKFTAFQVKIILKGTSSSYPPRVKDMRGIALAI
tara:strand:+ start:17 stop:2650 length:2634 start_codon:yes stop_codon:yes gene_type:complete